jgi:hypothetical protein
MRHATKACTRCGWRRITNSRTPDVCVNCRGQQERVDPGDDHIQWDQDGLIKRGTVYPSTTRKDN